MAVGIKGGGFYSYDPLTRFKKPKPTDATLPPAVITPSAPAEEVANIPTLSGRLAAARVAPGQPGMGGALSTQVRDVYAGENAASLQEARMGQANELMEQQRAFKEQQITSGFTSLLGEQINQRERESLPGMAASALGLDANIPADVRGKTALAGAAIATGAGALAMGIPAMATSAVAKTGVMTKLLHSSVLKLLIGGSLIAKPLKMVSDAKAALTSSIQSMDLILESAKAGLITPEEALVQYNDIQGQIESLESSMYMWSSLNLFGGGKDVEVDIKNAKLNFFIKRNTLIKTIYGVQ